MTRFILAAAIALAAAGVAVAAELGSGAVKGTVTSAGGEPVANAVVLIDGPTVSVPPGARHAMIDQRDDTFVPHVIAIPVGTTVDFPNSDTHLHNVVSTSKPKAFDLGMYAAGQTKSVTFDAPGVVALRCNVHPKMEAYVVVHTNLWAAVTDERGEYTITGVPAGSYGARVWHERLAEKSVPTVVREGQVARLDVRLEKRP